MSCQPNSIRVDAVPPAPWRNGGGVTRELLRWPADDGWRLRISVADIHTDGPFSVFAGVQRRNSIGLGAKQHEFVWNDAASGVPATLGVWKA